ncbi:hypothetical protein [Pararhodonellum marinum]|uniref:hypothetical protein n=1 Tax=Pararhodonellum marinum TaxID=2755358 RepID=UPI00188F471A|nr:hypothetical protein [Pararhodonellum marinum]
MENQKCPICHKGVAYSERYPNYLCGDCVHKATDWEGRAVVFYNTAISGHGCAGEYRDSGEKYHGNSCYVEGIACEAREARFGGIVMERVQ